jgi:hypothetical protein
MPLEAFIGGEHHVHVGVGVVIQQDAASEGAWYWWVIVRNSFEVSD